jgi:Alw26I/Eco31I/Esp3I family type II restriction m6 adenine DNA methyltransferase
MEHLAAITEKEKKHEYHSKSLAQRLTGCFYTGELIGRELSLQVANYLRNSKSKLLKIIDPFCGDGRLLCWLIEVLNAKAQLDDRKIEVHAWDFDSVAVNTAQKAIMSAIKKYSIDGSIIVKSCDTFSFALDFFNQFDAVITNPPWDVLKPDTRELNRFNPVAKKEYIDRLRKFDSFLASKYPASQPDSKLYGWGTNLARCGLQVSLNLLKKNGVCGIVSPSSFLADQSSLSLRTWLLKNYHFASVNYYPAELKLFKTVDQDSITMIIKESPSDKFSVYLQRYRTPNLHIRERVNGISTASICANKGILPLKFGKAGFTAMQKLQKLPTWSDLEKGTDLRIWAGRELDETGLAEKLCASGTVFVKGLHIKRFGFTDEPRYFLKLERSNNPESTHHKRIVWRDVSRPSQKLRIQATLIPEGWITGNSLNVAYLQKGSQDSLLTLLALLNSLVVEFQVRTSLSTSHISLGTVRNIRLPIIDIEFAKKTATIAKSCIKWGYTLMPSLEVLVAKAFGFNKQDYSTILDAFPKLDENERSALLSDKYWETKCA